MTDIQDKPNKPIYGVPDASGAKMREFRHDISLDEKEHEKFQKEDLKQATKSLAILYGALAVPVLIIVGYYLLIRDWLGSSGIWFFIFVILPIILFVFLLNSHFA